MDGVTWFEPEDLLGAVKLSHKNFSSLIHRSGVSGVLWLVRAGLSAILVLHVPIV